MPIRLLATKLLEEDPHVESRVFRSTDRCSSPQVHGGRRVICRNLHGWSADQVVSGNRHALAHAHGGDRVTKAGHQPRLGPARVAQSRCCWHPVSGGPLMDPSILGGFFTFVYTLGQRVEAPLLGLFDRLSAVRPSTCRRRPCSAP